MNVVVFTGGVGGAKLCDGLACSVGEEHLTIIVNTADDFELYGLHISPDLDTVMYTLAGIANPVTGWGIEGDTFNNFDMLARYGVSPWFRLGDRDLATHLLRTQLLREGMQLSAITRLLAQRLGVKARILPMTDDRVRTVVDTDEGLFHFQEYFVRLRWQPEVRSLIYEGAEEAHPNDEALRAIETADTIIIAPSNLYLSIDPILALPGMKDALLNAAAPIIAVTPIISGEAVKGPAAKLMRELGVESSAVAVAQHYADFINGFVLDQRDAALEPHIASMGIGVLVTDTLMTDRKARARLACEVVNFADRLRPEKLGGCRMDLLPPQA
ncbi:MAG: 2-phospho-L-lactate transferase [Thermoflexales bacterium]|nr:2-phospho-L-lactate transferase [Thermoflexales bacterium]MCS7324820.1 2-phospho-L-lactate transferase [Thermoflexales bacterium]MCX7939520.1 2-phospho-L-lactate transferase [Thermoflexales bacterium]MDW8054718.1 2-phospho-L-lactate transferase [Anaerolineae bacterium]MDW8293431.1 2-phospho-L-lactate transferase [Anaerolineae bacterium]